MTKPNQRHFTRSSLESAVDVVDIESGIGFRAQAINVSDEGLLLDAPMEPALGAQMYVTVEGIPAPPCEFKVTRIERTARGFHVAAARTSHG